MCVRVCMCMCTSWHVLTQTHTQTHRHTHTHTHTHTRTCMHKYVTPLVCKNYLTCIHAYRPLTSNLTRFRELYKLYASQYTEDIHALGHCCSHWTHWMMPEYSSEEITNLQLNKHRTVRRHQWANITDLYPSMLQTTLASSSPHSSSQTVPRSPFLMISTLPSPLVVPFTSSTLTSVLIKQQCNKSE